ncbi:phage baseplate assembly protein [Citromicrobium bathyomarinum]|uniref:phage baseplate assembly protein n=1 Tax=Citromicrobium bathyomarinum TaxID=72174 RepID=UPI00315AB9F7
MTGFPEHDVTLQVAGMAYSGWTSLDILRSIDQMAGVFRLRLAAKERTGAEDWRLEEGAACRVMLAGEPLITGYIDSVTRFLTSEERGIDITGRDRTADLVDCSAIHRPGSWANRRLEQIAAELVAPFGIPIDIAGETGAPFKRFALQQGETVFAAIERMCRYRGLVAWSTGDGRLQIGNPDDGSVIATLTEGENVLGASASRDYSDRFSDYIVKGQASGDDSRSGAAVAQVQGEAGDPAVTRNRPLLLVGEEQSDRASLVKRARWEAAVRAGRSQPAEVTVPGWLDPDGRPYRPGARARCAIPSIALSGDLLIERVALLRDAESGTVTIFGLVPPEAWTQLAEAEERA